MKRENESLDLKSLERELTTQTFRYQLALKDGAVDSIIKEVNYQIASLEKKIQKLTQELSIGSPSLSYS